MTYRTNLIALICLSALLVATVPALAATVVVGTCVPSKISYASLTEAVQGVPSGTTIQVCPGNYAEQIIINKSLTLKGLTSGNGANPVIVPPASGLVNNAFSSTTNSFWGLGTPFAAQIVIQGGADVTLTGIALDATGFNIATCSPVVAGVLVQDASATLNQVAVKNQFNPCSASGSGIGVLNQNDSSIATTMTVKNTTFVNAGQAFESDGAGNTSTLTNSSFAGNPASNSNAISILSGDSTIQGNTMSNFNYPLAGTTNFSAAAWGIYLSCVPGSSVVNNHIATTQVGIYALNGCTTTAVSITGNDISDAQFMAIFAGGTNGLIQGNDIRTSQTAIRLPAGSAGNTIQNNTINDTCAAFGLNPAAGANTIGTNTITNATNLTLVNTTALCP